MDVINQQRILDEVTVERKRQFEKWGDQIHTVTHWMAILGEEFGEADKEAVEFEALRPMPSRTRRKEIILECLRAELIETAAVAVAMIEWIDEGATYPEWWAHLSPEYIFQFVAWYQEAEFQHAVSGRTISLETLAEFKYDPEDD